MAGNAASYAGAPPTALGDASLSAWIAPTDGSGFLYYPKGAMAGFLLDVMIRDASDNRRSLDDVMRGLYETTWKRGKGFTAAEWWAAVERNAGTTDRCFREFARRYVDGREELPFDSILPLAGLRLATDTLEEPRLGISTALDSGEARVTAVGRTGAAAAAGIQVGDRLVSLGGIPVSDDASFDAFRGRYRGTTLSSLQAVVRRDGELRTIQFPVRLFGRTLVRVLVVADAPAKAVRIRHGIWSGTVDH